MNKAHESFLVLFFDVKNCLTYAEELFRGTLSQISIYTGDVLKAALDHNAASVMLGQFTPATDYLLNVNFLNAILRKLYMETSRFTGSQIINILKQVETAR